MNTTPSTIKLTEEEWNNMPGREFVETKLNDYIGKGLYKVVDGDMDCWKNDAATLVIELDGYQLHQYGAKMSLELMAGVGMLVNQLGIDEFNCTPSGTSKSNMILRFWWD